MNRAERRLQKKQEEKPLSKKKLSAWVKSLTKEQQNFIGQFVEMETEKNFNRLTHALDVNFTAAMILKTEMNIDDIGVIFEDVFELMKEDREKDEELKRKFKSEGEFISHMKNMEKEVSARIEELFNQGLKAKDIREKLFLEFPSLSKAKITNCVKKMKEIIDQVNKTNAAVNKIIKIMDKEEPKEEAKKEEKKVEPKKVEEVKPVVKEDKPVNPPKTEESKVVVAPKEKALKISKMEVKGAFATYTVESKKVAVKLDKKFTKDTWKKFSEEMNAVFDML